ncbi:MAG: transglutaminase domain-containing protein [Pirellulales bacterium]
MRRRTFCLGALAGTVAAVGRGVAAPQSSGRVQYSDWQEYRVQHAARFTNGDMDLTRLEIWLPVARSDQEQVVSQVRTTPTVKPIADPSGTGNVAQWFLTRQLPGVNESLVCEVSYTVRVARMEADLAAVEATTWAEQPKLSPDDIALRRETRIEIDDPRVSEQAEKLRRKTKGPGQFARAAYEWVLERTRYQLHEGIGGTKYCLDQGSGECGDYSVLFVALCRAAGIAARPAVGYWLEGKPDAWHVWAEFRLPTGEWVPVDGSLGDGDERQRAAHFGRRDNRRVAVMKTYDVRVPLLEGAHDTIDFLQVGTWWWWASRIGTRPKCDFTAVGRPVAGRSGT